MTSTIFALATAPGRAAVAVMRLSGPGTGPALRALAGQAPSARRASLRRLRGGDGEALDEALVLWMPGPASFTGEDCAELHLHGGSAIVEAVGARLLELGLEPAEPGAFTRRAFQSGRIDLVQAEAIADLVDAETEAQRRQALAHLEGASSVQHAAWRDRLIDVLARLEAAVDFPDEDLPATLAAACRPAILSLAAELEDAARERRGEQIREGFRVALMGAPNAGKSSLFNALLGRDAAIVTPIPGTTRDVIEAPMVLAGRRVILADLAGIRDSDDPIEQEGVRRAHAWAEAADLKLLLSPSGGERLTTGADELLVTTKIDTAPWRRPPTGGVSAVTGEGVDHLRRSIEERVVAATTASTAPAATRERHRLALREAGASLRQASEALHDPELAAEDVRRATRSLQRLAGRIDAEAVLEQVFSSFCIGK